MIVSCRIKGVDDLVKKEEMPGMIEKKFERLEDDDTSKNMDKIARYIYPSLPVDEEAVESFDYLVSLEDWSYHYQKKSFENFHSYAVKGFGIYYDFSHNIIQSVIENRDEGDFS